MKTSDVLEGIERERTRLLDAFDALGPRASTAWVTEKGGWTAKDVLAHLIHYSGQIAWALGAQIEPPAYVVQETERLTGQQWNERAVEYWKEVPAESVRDEFQRHAALLVEQVQHQSDEDMLRTDAIPWPGEDRPLWEFIGHDTFLYEWPAHAEQMERAVASG